MPPFLLPLKLRQPLRQKIATRWSPPPLPSLPPQPNPPTSDRLPGVTETRPRVVGTRRFIHQWQNKTTNRLPLRLLLLSLKIRSGDFFRDSIGSTPRLWQCEEISKSVVYFAIVFFNWVLSACLFFFLLVGVRKTCVCLLVCFVFVLAWFTMTDT